MSLHCWECGGSEAEALCEQCKEKAQSAALATLRARVEELEKAARHAENTLSRIRPCGHSGDEESGEHDEDCQRCDVDAAIAHINEALNGPCRCGGDCPPNCMCDCHSPRARALLAQRKEER